MVRQLTSVWYSGVGFRISNLNFTVPWFITWLWNHFEIRTEHDNFEIWYTCSSYWCLNPLRLDFQNLYYLFIPDFMFENLELTCHLTSFHDKFIVAPSGWKPPDADAPSVCRESTQILQDRETFSKSMQAPLTLKVKPMLISTYTFDTNIRWNKIAIYSVRFDVKSTWFDSLLHHFALFHSTAYPAGELHSQMGNAWTTMSPKRLFR